MKKITIILTLFFCLANFNGQSQNLYDNQWIIGTDNTTIIIDWKEDSIYKGAAKAPAYMRVSLSNANDAQGNFLYYTQGCAILGKNYQVIPNGTQINPGEIHQQACGGGGSGSLGGYVAENSGIFLPKPSDSTFQYLFHTAMFDKYANETAFPPYKFYYTEIDTKKGNYGTVTKKNVLLIEDTLSYIGVLTCKHANGKDWWIIVPEFDTDGYYTALFTSKGVEYVGHQVFKAKRDRGPVDRRGQAIFSPDGSKYVRSDPVHGTYIYDFDRCTGKLSNLVFIDTLGFYACSGVCISPNSRYLYLSNRDVLHQFDLFAPDIEKSKVKIADYDGFVTWFDTQASFYKMALAPNGKIYMGTTNSSDVMHIIHNPDEKGLLCDFKQHDLALPDIYYISLPNFPNFRLGKKEGVICPSLVAVSDTKMPIFTAKLFPNPTKEKVVLTWDTYLEQEAAWELYNQYGQLVFSHQVTLSTQEAVIDISDIENGVYFWKLNIKEKIGQSGKLVILK